MNDFISEKSNGEIQSDEVYHITLENIRQRDKETIFNVFSNLNDFDLVVVDAVNDEDMDFFVACLTVFLAQHDKRFILSLIHISEPTRRACRSRMPSSA